MYTPKEIAENYLSACRAKAALPLGRMFLLACLAGAFVALAGVASTAAAATVGNPSLAKLVSGCVFPAGLAMVIVAGSELFTGNNLMIMGVLARTITARADAAQLARCLSGQLCGRGARCGAVRVGARLFRVRGKLAASVGRHRADEGGADVRRRVRARHPLQLPRVHRRLDGQCSQGRRR